MRFTYWRAVPIGIVLILLSGGCSHPPPESSPSGSPEIVTAVVTSSPPFQARGTGTATLVSATATLRATVFPAAVDKVDSAVVPTAVPMPTPTDVATVGPTASRTVAPIRLADPTSISGPVVIVGSAIFSVEVADAASEYQLGLGGRDSLPVDSGMLFVFRTEDQYTFWMKGMRFPLDFIWITKDCVVLEVTKDVPQSNESVPDGTLPVISSSKPILYVLEINAGSVEQRGIVSGDPVVFQGNALTSFGCS